MNRREIQALCAQFDIRPTKSLGQNFLIDDAVVRSILQTADVTAADLVLEIGPGLGALTAGLAQTAGRVIALEIDRHLLPALRQVLASYTNCSVIQIDALQADFNRMTADWAGPVKIAANLPYYITTPLIEKVLSELPRSNTVLLMLQQEAADRLLASPGGKAYGPLAILAASYGRAERIFSVAADSFWPAPHVDSCVVRLDATGQLPIVNWPAYRRFLGACFIQRRKTLANSLRAGGILAERLQALPEFLTGLGLPVDVRPEKLDKNHYFALFHHLYP